MHSNCYFLLDLEEDDPRQGQGLLDVCYRNWLEHYDSVLDDNNWFKVLYCAEQNGQSAVDQELDCEARTYLDLLRDATVSVAYDLSIYSSGSQESVFLDLNPWGGANSGQDDQLLSQLGDEALGDLIAERGSAYLASSYTALDKEPLSVDGYKSYRRGAFARCFEQFFSSSRRPFSSEMPTPYQYPAVDLRHHQLTGREAILVVDIHT